MLKLYLCLPVDYPPDTVDDLLYALEEACANSTGHENVKDIIARTSQKEAGWLSRAVREKLTRDRENLSEEIEQKLQVSCLYCRSAFFISNLFCATDCLSTT